MPKSHDAKPRNKSRREKYQKELAKGRKLIPTRRQIARGLLRKHYQDAVKAQRELEQSLRALGIKWRALETAVAKMADGKWSGVDKALLNQLFAAHGLRFDEAA